MADEAPTLLSINARDPDGLDTSWLFDVDFAPLRGRQVLITGDRAYDLAVRLEVNEVPFQHVRTFADAVRRGPAGPAGGDRELHRVPGHPSGVGPCQLRAPAHRLDLPRPAVHLRRPGQPADPGPPGAAARHAGGGASRSAPTSRCPPPPTST